MLAGFGFARFAVIGANAAQLFGEAARAGAGLVKDEDKVQVFTEVCFSLATEGLVGGQALCLLERWFRIKTESDALPFAGDESAGCEQRCQWRESLVASELMNKASPCSAITGLKRFLSLLYWG